MKYIRRFFLRPTNGLYFWLEYVICLNHWLLYAINTITPLITREGLIRYFTWRDSVIVDLKIHWSLGLTNTSRCIIMHPSEMYSQRTYWYKFAFNNTRKLNNIFYIAWLRKIHWNIGLTEFYCHFLTYHMEIYF